MAAIKFGGACLNQIPLDWEHNTNNIKKAVKKAKNEKVEILLLPELSITGYGMQDLFLHPWVANKAKNILNSLIGETAGIMVTIGLPVLHNNRLYNVVAVIHDKKILGFTAKQILANDGVHYEKRWFNTWPQNEKSVVEFGGHQVPFGDLRYEYKGYKIGIEICEDAWCTGEERPANRMLEDKTDIILNASASHFGFGKTEFREKLVIQSSEKYNCTYIFANMLGNESGRMIFDGDILMAQKGKLLLRNEILSFKDFNLRIFDIEVNARDLPSGLEKLKVNNQILFTRVVALGLFDYWRKSKTKGFVLSLSGGADSSCCAVLVSEMVRRGFEELGAEGFCEKANIPFRENPKEVVKEILHCVYQSTDNSSDETYKAAETLALELGAGFDNWSVQDEVTSISEKLENALHRKLKWEMDDIALQNIQARMRSPGIWMLANIKGSLLLTTSNRSEGDVGYTTMDGDTSGSLAPIAGIDKNFIRKWLIWAERELGYGALKAVNNLQPTAELRPGKNQTDESDLMPYHIMVEIERLAVKEGKSPLETFEIMIKTDECDAESLKTYISTFYRLLGRNQWKRERLAPSFHIDNFNIDPKTWFRFPIISSNFKEEIDLLMDKN